MMTVNLDQAGTANGHYSFFIKSNYNKLFNEIGMADFELTAPIAKPTQFKARSTRYNIYYA